MANNQKIRGKDMNEREIWELIRGELSYLRERADDQGKELRDHIKDEAEYQRCMQQQLSALKTAVEVRGTEQKVKMSGMIIGSMLLISTFVSTFTAWLFTKVG